MKTRQSNASCPFWMNLSKWAYFFPLTNGGVYYNSLSRQIVFVSNSEKELISDYLHHKFDCQKPVEVIDELTKAKILVQTLDEDIEQYRSIEKDLPPPYIGIMQLVVASSCNLACKYCFVGNNNISSTHFPSREYTIMKEETAIQALRFFSCQMLKQKEYFNSHKEIIFYGGEPLINMPVIESVVHAARSMQSKGELPHDLSFSMVTNGTLLNNTIADKLKSLEINMAISLDGVNAEANKKRIDRSGKETFSRILSGIDASQKAGLPFGLSITITEETLKQQDAIISFMEEYGVCEASFNVLIGINNPVYFKRAAKFIVDFYKKTKNLGFVEDRMLRKINALSSSHFYFYDCAALAGNQIVVMPNGDIGICQGEISSGEFNIGNVFDESFNVIESPLVKEWNHLSPFFKEKCQACFAIGVCGGGCPINARKISPTHSLQDLDERFCTHTKESLLFLFQELRDIIDNQNKGADQ